MNTGKRIAQDAFASARGGDVDFKRIATKLVEGAAMDLEMARKRFGPDHLWVRIKENSARLAACKDHRYRMVPRGEADYGLTKARCENCQGTVDAGNAMAYIDGRSHGSDDPDATKAFLTEFLHSIR